MGTAPEQDRPRRVQVATRRSGGPLGDRRGLTAAGCAVMLLVFGFAGALLDLFAGHDLWVMFGIAFIGAAALAAARCHAEDLAATIVFPPLAYFVIAFIFTIISPRSGTHTGGSKQFAIDLGGELVFSAPILLAATIVALGLATARGRASAARRRSRGTTRVTTG
ncbi:MAG TPA: DUF6542 domain-containing protein [Frankiaceae bacterium]|nr:DUF6542 domain-containing protein [Frankiaceae bacterium]